ncbi:Eco57I restriction-modification methylase domain-containing protein [bacterium]|nr:Eco57I restriction-modification methylase domain-containing protein [bacterium]
MSTELKTKIEESLKTFAANDLKTAANNFFRLLGYQSSRTKNITKEDFRLRFQNYEQQQNKQTNLIKKALFENWTNVHLIFQITDREISFQQNTQLLPNEVQPENFSSYIFFAIELEKENFSRTELAQATRSINKIFQTHVLVLFKHKTKITIAIINRRKNKSDETKNVLEKVTLIKDINFENPHRAHIEILFDLTFEELSKKQKINNFFALHKAWEEVLDINELNKNFYNEISNWYFRALQQVKFPTEKNTETRNAQNLIRLLTRLIFVWFLKEKGLISDELFSEEKLKTILNDLEPPKTTFYRAILQNLFFATLNVPISERKFRSDKNFQGKNPDFQNHFRFRYKNCFKNEDSLEKLFAEIPFLNGGLFECLDSETEKTDCFSENPKNLERLSVPNSLFFSEKQQVDLNKDLETKNKNYETEGLIRILKHYKFTIAENTPVEEEIALDPELLGRVFENLLASYNEETKTTARKQTGSFYTPREIVDFMVDESLVAYFSERLSKNFEKYKNEEQKKCLQDFLRQTLSYTEKDIPFDESETKSLISAVNEVKILDPACGSGAFPMGILHKLVYFLSKLDPENEKWKELQIQKQEELIRQDIQTAEKINDFKAREKAENELSERLENIKNIFSDKNELDYSRKLFLIENCIFGLDIQTAAIQISKLRFFISLVIHQTKNQSKENFGILTLPNLETKFICANSLLGVTKTKQVSIFELEEINSKENELRKIREKHFNARTQKEKDFCRKQDQRLRTELKQLFEKGLGSKDSELLVSWDPYNQNQSAVFFDSEWMFCQKEGFDVVIGNPPYGAKIEKNLLTQILKKVKDTKNSNSASIFIDFAKNQFTKSDGIFSFIVPKSLLYSESWFSLVKALLKGTIVLVDVEKAFENVLLEQVVFVCGKEILQETYEAKKFLNEQFSRSNRFSKKTVEKFKAWICDVSQEELQVAEKILKQTNLVYLNEISKTLSGCSFDRKQIKEKGDFPILGGKSISRYRLREMKGYVNKNDLSKHLEKIKLILVPKIISQDIIAHIQNPLPHIKITSFFDSNGTLLTLDTVQNTILLTFEFNYKFILSILNSSFASWYFYKFVYCCAIRTMHFNNYYIGKLPVPRLSEQEQLPFVEKVELILSGKAKGANTSELEREIDLMVYKLYDLNEEEIKIIEKN